MNVDHITTPFGRRTLTLASVAAQVAARDVEGKAAHKWRTFSAIAEAKVPLGVSDRTLAVLNALLTFIPETALSPGQLVVFASNRALALRTHGMAETTLRRHLNALVQVGLIVRRDSPNGKRYARKGQDGELDAVFGFDLAPILARSGEFEALASKVAADRRAAAVARERVTILRRDVRKMIDVGLALGAPGEWTVHQEAYELLCHRLPRTASPEVLGPLVAGLTYLSFNVGKSLEVLLESENMDASADQDDGHLQNSKPEYLIDLEPSHQERKEAKPESRQLSLGLVLKACPDVAMYDKNEVRTWRDLLGTVAKVRGMLGISPTAWEEAREVMGDQGAAATVAAILQRAESIRSPGGYLRSLTERSRAGRFSAWPMMLALLRTNGPDAPRAGPKTKLQTTSRR